MLPTLEADPQELSAVGPIPCGKLIERFEIPTRYGALYRHLHHRKTSCSSGECDPYYAIAAIWQEDSSAVALTDAPRDYDVEHTGALNAQYRVCEVTMSIRAHRSAGLRRPLDFVLPLSAVLAIACVDRADHAVIGASVDAAAPASSASSWVQTSAANPTGWADRAERRCAEGFACDTRSSEQLAGGVECQTPSGAPYVGTRC